MKALLIPGPNYTTGYEAVTHMETKLGGWKATLQKQKRKLQANRLDALSRLPLDLNSVTQVVENSLMWRTFERVVRRSRSGEEVSAEELKVAMGAVTISSLYKSWQRPGVAANCTVEEFWQTVHEPQKEVYVVSVKVHKTGSLGSAKLILDPTMMAKIRAYIKHVHPHLAEPGNDIAELFIMPGCS